MASFALPVVFLSLTTLAGACQSKMRVAKRFEARAGGGSLKDATPEAPTVRSGGNAVAIAWEAVPGAVTYEVWRAEGDDGEFVLIGTSPDCQFRDDSVKAHRLYRYHVVAVDARGQKSAPSPEIYWKSTNSVPVLGYLPAFAVGEYKTLNVDLAASDADGDALTFRCVKSCPDGLSVSPDGKLRWKPSYRQIGTHVFTVGVEDEAGDSAQAEVRVTVSARITPGMAASVVIGQADFTSGAADRGGTDPSRDGFNIPDGVSSYGDRIFVADRGNSRVLFFDRFPSANGAPADKLWGQDDFTTGTSGSGAFHLATTRMAVYNGKEFFIADNYNHRVLGWNKLPPGPATPPDFVIGQADVNGNQANQGGAVAANTLSGEHAISLFAHEDKLLVTDRGNSRILVFQRPFSTNMGASLVIGQTSMAVGSTADPPTASSLAYPGGVWTDGKRLAVADAFNHRVLLWHAFPTRNGQAADVVIGQGDMDANLENRGGPASASSLKYPFAVASDGDRLFVGDGVNNRILVFNAFPTVNGASADYAIGQPDLVTTTPGTSATVLRNLTQLWWTGDRLLVADQGNHRVLILGD